MVQCKAMEHPNPKTFRKSFPLAAGASVDWLSTLRAYINEDWLTTGIAEYLAGQAEAAQAARLVPCLGCGRRFPRSDLWVHARFDDVAYCDVCYYRRFGRHSA